MNFIERAEYRIEQLNKNSLDNHYINDLFLKSERNTLLFPITSTEILNIVIKQPVSAVAGRLINQLLGVLWPSDNSNIFESLKDQIQSLVNESIDDATWMRLSAKINELHVRLKTFANLIESENQGQAYEYYKEISTYLVGLEENFKICGMSNNFYFSPLFVVVVNLIIGFRREVINNKDRYGLTQKEYETEMFLLKDMILKDSGAKDYINELYNTYNTELLSDLKKIKVGISSKDNYYYNNIVVENSYYQRAGLNSNTSLLWYFLAKQPESLDFFNLIQVIPQGITGTLYYSGFKNYKDIFEIMKSNNESDLIKVTTHANSDKSPFGTHHILSSEMKYSNGNEIRTGYRPYLGFISTQEFTPSKKNPLINVLISVTNKPEPNLISARFMLADRSVTQCGKNDGFDVIKLAIGNVDRDDSLYQIHSFFIGGSSGYYNYLPCGFTTSFYYDYEQEKNISYIDVSNLIESLNG